MRTINKVILVGNVTRDPELKTTTNGQPIATFGIATNRTWVTASHEKKSSAEFHNIVVWGKLAEICHTFLHKGKLVYIEGYLKTRSWDNESGVRSFRTEVVANDMIILSGREGHGEDNGDAGENGADLDHLEGQIDPNDRSAPPDSSLDDLL